MLCLPAAPQSGGQADIAVQGYYLAGSGQPLSDTSGASVRFRQFLPGVVLLTGVVEDYRARGGWQTCDNALELRGLAWLGYRWNLSGGDFRLAPLMVANPFTNIFYPELTLRGAMVETSRGNATYSAFYGVQTLYQGPRIPYRLSTGERAAGATVQYHWGEQLTVGLRLLRLSESQPVDGALVLPLYKRFDTYNSASLQALYTPLPGLRLFGEASAASISGVAAGQRPLSMFTGLAYETERFTFRANYVDQGAFYLPLAGFYVGDRRGPFGEVRIKALRRLELFGSISSYRNNRERDARLASYSAVSESAGFSAQLPLRFSLSGQVNLVRFDTTDSNGETRSNNSQWTATLNRPLGRQNLRLTYRDMRLANNGQGNRQTSREFEDLIQFRRLVVGGSVRLDSSGGADVRNTIFTRANVQLRAGRLTAYAYFDIGRDLVNRTIFATNALNSTVIGASAELPSHWSLQTELFRSTLSMAVNPANVFLLQSQGVAVPTALSGVDQWSLYVRAARQIRWGQAPPGGNFESYTIARIPITGAIEGEVYETTPAGRRPVAGIPVDVDGSRLALSEASGAYRFAAIPEGQHELGLRLSELPANFEPGANSRRTVLISTRRTTRVDFEVVRLGAVCGRILDAPDPHSLENLIIHVQPLNRYTTPETDGQFCFYNLPPGEYEASVDLSRLPPLTHVVGPAAVRVRLDPDDPPKPVEFRLGRDFESKPVRKRTLDGPKPPARN